MTMALVLFAGLAQAGTAYLPAGARGLAVAEMSRLAPSVEVAYYTGDRVERYPSEPLVIFVDRCPKEVREGYARAGQPAPLAAALLATHTAFVFVRDLEDYLGMPASDPRFRIALGRVIAHELEHLRRNSPDHDAKGFFKACLGRDEMLTIGWGQ